MKKRCKTLINDKIKVFKDLKTIVLLALLALLNTGCYPATLAPPEDNLRSKQLTPPPGKALVYFYLDYGAHDWVDVSVSLNGFESRISKDTYVLWELFPGTYLLTFQVEDHKLEIQCEANKIYYYENDYKSVFNQKLRQVSPAIGRVKINELSLVKWFKDIPAPPEAEATVGEGVTADVSGSKEPVKTKVPAQVPPDEAIAILEVKIDKVSDESRTFYDPMGRPIATVPLCVFSPGEHIRSSLTQAKFRIESEDMKETPDATLTVRYREKNKRLGLGSPKTFFLSYELIHRTRGKLLEGGVGPKGCDTQGQLENHPQFRNIGLLIRDAFIRLEAKASANEAKQAVDTAQRPVDLNIDSDKVDTERLKSSKQVNLDDASDVGDYFADMYAGNKDGKSTMKEIASLNDHHMGGIAVILHFKGSIEFVDEVLEQSSQLAKEAKYKRAYEDEKVGLAILMKARDLRCLDALARLKGAEWLSDPEKLARTDMADLGGAFLAEYYSWKTDDIRKVLEQQKHGREGFRIFIVALMSDWSPPNYYNRISSPELPLQEKVIKKVKEISNGKFSPQVIASLPDLIPGKTFAEKVAFLLDD